MHGNKIDQFNNVMKSLNDVFKSSAKGKLIMQFDYMKVLRKMLCQMTNHTVLQMMQLEIFALKLDEQMMQNLKNDCSGWDLVVSHHH
jgi:hypothetical protein